MLGTTEIIIIAGVVVLLFGGAAIPRFAKSIGKAKREFEKGVKEVEDEAKIEKETERTEGSKDEESKGETEKNQ
ncbi:MAG: twin-arginine translocase TatA/TatE family subunit [Spirochaetes bacterium]|nr:MAG: twin-arginine translocase TatA/TatE family subunit [Spirochaetota bacterium]